MKTHTVNVFVGTLAYVAPEVHAKKAKLSKEELKLADIWSLGMVMFSLFNPDSTVPYFSAAYQVSIPIGDFPKYVSEKAKAGVKPRQSEKYEQFRRSV